jgi:thiol-disulfide isomerase/thioredoxin
MSPTRLSCAVLVLAALVAPAQAQTTDPKPPTTQSPTKAPPKKNDEKKSEDKSKNDAAYPPIVQKKLWANKDVRGKQPPSFHVEKWLSKEPDRKGKTVLIDFWATWCPPCRELVPELVQWQKKYKDDLVVIGISDEEPAKLESFMKANGVDYAIATDTKKKMSKELDVQGIPHVLVISSDGIVRWQGFPLADQDQLTEEKLKQIIEADKAARAKSGPKIVKPPEKKTDEKAPEDKKPDEKAPDKKLL